VVMGKSMNDVTPMDADEDGTAGTERTEGRAGISGTIGEGCTDNKSSDLGRPEFWMLRTVEGEFASSDEGLAASSNADREAGGAMGWGTLKGAA
jgi:hypothetical protein